MAENRRSSKRSRENTVAFVEPNDKKSIQLQLNSALCSPVIVKKKVKTEISVTPEDAQPVGSSNVKANSANFTPNTPASFTSLEDFQVDLGNASWADLVESEERELKGARRRSTPTKNDPKPKKSLFDLNFKAEIQDGLEPLEEVRRSPRKRKTNDPTAVTPNKVIKTEPKPNVWDIRQAAAAATDFTLSPLPRKRTAANEDDNSNSNFTRRVSARLQNRAEPTSHEVGKPVPIDFSSLATADTSGKHVDIRDLREKLSGRRQGNSSVNSSFNMSMRSNDSSMGSGRGSRKSSFNDSSELPPWEYKVDGEFIEPKNGWERDPNTLCRRQKDIDKGKNSDIYKRYVAEIPKKQRVKGVHPKTPNKYLKVPRRSWDMQVRLWRKLLYCYDDPSKALRDVSFMSASDTGDSSYVASSTHSSVDESEDNMSTLSDDFNLSGGMAVAPQEDTEGTFNPAVSEETSTLQADQENDDVAVKTEQTDFSQLLTH